MLVLVNGTILGSIRDIFVKHKFAIYSTADSENIFGHNGKENGNGGECVRKRRRKWEKKNIAAVIIKPTRFVSSEVDLPTLRVPT
jgi:hypothetical protein